jgi:hypothetical protein
LLWRIDRRERAVFTSVRAVQYLRRMTVVRFVRRWGVLALGVAIFLFGFTVFVTHTTIIYEWTAYDPLSGRAFLPGAPTSHSDIGAAGEADTLRRVSFRGHLSMTVGLTLVAGWVAFRAWRRAKPHPDAAEELMPQGQVAAG